MFDLTLLIMGFEHRLGAPFYLKIVSYFRETFFAKSDPTVCKGLASSKLVKAFQSIGIIFGFTFYFSFFLFFLYKV